MLKHSGLETTFLVVLYNRNRKKTLIRLCTWVYSLTNIVVFIHTEYDIIEQKVVSTQKVKIQHEYCARYKNENKKINQRTIGPVNAHLIYWPSKAQSIQNLENIW